MGQRCSVSWIFLKMGKKSKVAVSHCRFTVRTIHATKHVSGIRQNVGEEIQQHVSKIRRPVGSWDGEAVQDARLDSERPVQ